jgi:hypothetical protein
MAATIFQTGVPSTVRFISPGSAATSDAGISGPASCRVSPTQLSNGSVECSGSASTPRKNQGAVSTVRALNRNSPVRGPASIRTRRKGVPGMA